MISCPINSLIFQHPKFCKKILNACQEINEPVTSEI